MAQQTRAGGLPGFVVSAENLQVVLKELRALEPNLRKELVAEMKRDVKPIGTDLLSKIPGAPPLSGFSPSRGDSPYIWRKPRMSVKTLNHVAPALSQTTLIFPNVRTSSQLQN